METYEFDRGRESPKEARPDSLKELEPDLSLGALHGLQAPKDAGFS